MYHTHNQHSQSISLYGEIALLYGSFMFCKACESYVSLVERFSLKKRYSAMKN